MTPKTNALVGPGSGNTTASTEPQLATGADAKRKVVQRLHERMRELETDVNLRNAEIDKRYGVMFKGELLANLKIKSGFDRTDYNYLPRVVDIHTAQLMGRGFQVKSNYQKDDLSVYDVQMQDPNLKAQQEQAKVKAKLVNGRRAADADIRMEAIRAMQRDNEDKAFWNRAARLASWSGIAIVKGWAHDKEKKWKYVLLETPQNFWRLWNNSNFREWDGDLYVYQIGKSKARREYGKFLKDGEDFKLAVPGEPWQRSSNGKDLERLTIPNCWVGDYVGYIDGFKVVKGEVVECKLGDEERMCLKIVGDVVVSAEGESSDYSLPQYWVINNLEEAQLPWGQSDLSDAAIQINGTLIETMSDWRTASWKVTFPKLKFMNFTSTNMPKLQERQAEGFALDLDQDIAAINLPNTLQEFPRLVDSLINSFVRVTKISRPMFEDPTVSGDSNQALMTQMKPLIDITEDKQARWARFLNDFFMTALKATAKFDDALREAVEEEDGWHLETVWPSVLRREDAAYQQMWLNRWNAGTVSPESYLEAMGTLDVSEEIDRIRDAMTDPLRAAMMGRALPAMAQALLTPPTADPGPKVSVSLRGDLTPEQEGNLAATGKMSEGPFSPSAGPQGSQGLAAGENADNQGYLSGNPFQGGTPINRDPQGNPISQPVNPSLTPDQNTGEQSVSQPGSGATPVSPQGAINQVAQRVGR